MMCLVTKSLELSGNSTDIVSVLKDILQLFEKIDGVNVDILMSEVSNAISTLENNDKYTTISIDDSPSVEVLKYLSKLNPNVSLKLQSEDIDGYKETIIKKGEIKGNNKYKTSFSLKLNNNELKLNDKNVKDFLFGELYYLLEESEDDETYKSLVLEEFSDIKFDDNYSKLDLIKTIDEVYEQIS